MSIWNLLSTQNFNEYWWLNINTAVMVSTSNTFSWESLQTGDALKAFLLLTVIWGALMVMYSLVALFYIRPWTGGFGILTVRNLYNYFWTFKGMNLFERFQMGGGGEMKFMKWEEIFLFLSENGLRIYNFFFKPGGLKTRLAAFLARQKEISQHRYGALPSSLMAEQQVLSMVHHSLKAFPELHADFSQTAESAQLTNVLDYYFLCYAGLHVGSAVSLNEQYKKLLQIVVSYYAGLSSYNLNSIVETNFIQYALLLLMWVRLQFLLLVLECYTSYWQNYIIFVRQVVMPVRDSFFHVMVPTSGGKLMSDTEKYFDPLGKRIWIISFFFSLMMVYVLGWLDFLSMPVTSSDHDNVMQAAGNFMAFHIALRQRVYESLPNSVKAFWNNAQLKVISAKQRDAEKTRLLAKETRQVSKQAAAADLASQAELRQDYQEVEEKVKSFWLGPKTTEKNDSVLLPTKTDSMGPTISSVKKISKKVSAALSPEVVEEKPEPGNKLKNYIAQQQKKTDKAEKSLMDQEARNIKQPDYTEEQVLAFKEALNKIAVKRKNLAILDEVVENHYKTKKSSGGPSDMY